MSDLILLLGVAGAGKDFRANQFIEDSKAFGKSMIQINFADELREMMWDLFNWKPKNDREYEWFKLISICNIPNLENVCFSNDSYQYKKENSHIVTGRELLQRMGTEVIRKRFPDFWAQLWSERVKTAAENGKKVVCSDLRFINELEYAMKLCTGKNHNPIKKTFIFCDYRSERYNATMNHASEKLAQRILKDGYKDGDELSFDYLEELIQEK